MDSCKCVFNLVEGEHLRGIAFPKRAMQAAQIAAVSDFKPGQNGNLLMGKTALYIVSEEIQIPG